jgi:hypothetical protein
VIRWREVRTIFKAVAAITVCIVLGMAALIGYLGYQSRRVGDISRKFVLGMTVEQVAVVFPTDFFTARIGVPIRNGPCRDASGAISPPEEYPVLFPDMKDDDEKGKELARDAAQIPLRLDRFELLDKHLRARNEWSILIQAWTSYIQESRPPDAIAYCRRGFAYLALSDFARGYADTKKSCELGCRECCTALRKLPPEKVAAIEATERRIADSAPACEPPVSSFSLLGPATDGKFNLRVYLPNATGDPMLKTVSRAEFADLLNREFKGREWNLGFTYLTATPQHLSFHLVVGRDGKVKEVSRVRGWD